MFTRFQKSGPAGLHRNGKDHVRLHIHFDATLDTTSSKGNGFASQQTGRYHIL